jgi:hypothetical protein
VLFRSWIIELFDRRSILLSDRRSILLFDRRSIELSDEVADLLPEPAALVVDVLARALTGG